MKAILVVAGVLSIVCFPRDCRADSSAENRDRRIAFVQWSPVGLDYSTYYSTPLGGGVVINRYLEVGAEYGRGQDPIVSGTATVESGTFTNAGLFARVFPFTNSLNVMLALHRRTWTTRNADPVYDRYYTGACDPTSGGCPARPPAVKGSVDASVTTASARIGNQWTFDFGLTAGVDWVAVAAPVTSSIRVHAKDGSLTGDDKALVRSDLKFDGKSLNDQSSFPGIAIVTIGWAF